VAGEVASQPVAPTGGRTCSSLIGNKRAGDLPSVEAEFASINCLKNEINSIHNWPIHIHRGGKFVPRHQLHGSGHAILWLHGRRPTCSALAERPCRAAQPNPRRLPRETLGNAQAGRPSRTSPSRPSASHGCPAGRAAQTPLPAAPPSPSSRAAALPPALPERASRAAQHSPGRAARGPSTPPSRGAGRADQPPEPRRSAAGAAPADRPSAAPAIEGRDRIGMDRRVTGEWKVIFVLDTSKPVFSFFNFFYINI